MSGDLLLGETREVLAAAKECCGGERTSATVVAAAVLYGAKALCLELAALRRTLAVRTGDPFREEAA